MIIVYFDVRVHSRTLNENSSQLEKIYRDISPRSDRYMQWSNKAKRSLVRLLNSLASITTRHERLDKGR